MVHVLLSPRLRGRSAGGRCLRSIHLPLVRKRIPKATDARPGAYHFPSTSRGGRVRGLQTCRLGRVEYEDGLTLMRLFGEARRQEQIPDTLLLLEHPPVLTLGRGAKPGHIVAPLEAL